MPYAGVANVEVGVVRGPAPNRLSRNGGVEIMAMPQRDDPPSRCALRRTSTIEAIVRIGASLSSMPSCMVTRNRPNASVRSCAG